MAATIPALGCSNHSRPDLQRYIPQPAAPGFPLTCVLADSLAAGAKTALDGMLSFYQGQEPGQIPGIFNQAQGYYWWIAGAAWNVSPDLHARLTRQAVMQYWWLTNDTSYNNLVMDAMMYTRP